MNSITPLDPDEKASLERLSRLADSIEPRPEFEADLESALRSRHRPQREAPIRTWGLLQFAGWAAAVLLLALVLNWLIKGGGLVRIPAVSTTPTPRSPSVTPESQVLPPPSPGPVGEGFDWRGTTLYLNAELPAGPEQAAVLQMQPEEAATTQTVRDLAARFGVQGQIYQSPGEIQGTANFMVTDGRQRLQVRSDRYFTYYPDYPAYLNTGTTLEVPDAESQIQRFLETHGISTPYRVEKSEIYGGFHALTLASGDLPTRHEHFKPSGYLFKFGNNSILSVEAGLLGYQEVGAFGLRTARQALDMVLDPGVQVGLLDSMASAAPGESPVWYRTFPIGTPVSLYMHLAVAAPLEGQEPFISLDGYPARGNVAGLEALQRVDLVHVTGRFNSQDGMQVFEVESWEAYSGYEDGLVGTLERDGGKVVFSTGDGQTLLIPDFPPDIPLPLENAFVLGVPEAGVYQWRSIDMRAVGGGGGGGGGIGLYRLNLSGTPVPFPTSTPAVTPLPPGQGAQYTVQAGDTLSSIAQAFGTTQEALAQANGIADPGMLFIGQVLVIPGSTAQQVEGWRGLVNITLLAQPDGSQQTQYGFMMDGGAGFYILQGDLAALAPYQNRPVTVWGVIDGSQSNGSPVIQIQRYEIPYQDLAFTILHGTESNKTVDGESITLLTMEDGQSYVMLTPDGISTGRPVEQGSEDRLVEALIIPGESYAGYPAIRAFSSAMAVNPKNGLPVVMPITADQPYTLEEVPPGSYTAPTASIERVELIYFITDPRYELPEPDAGPAYIQPMWRFTGHYSNGDVFEILVQALRQEYLSPEVQTVRAPG